MIGIISQLFINMTIIVSTVMLANMLMRERFFTKSIMNSLFNGFLSGLLGCILMIYSVVLAPDIIIDFRYVPILMMGIYVSFTAALEASIIIGLFRIAYSGFSRVTLIAFIVAIIVGIGSGMIGRSTWSITKKWGVSVALTCFSAGTGVYLVIYNLKDRFEILFIYVLATIIVSVLLFHLVEYVATFNRRYEKLKEEAEKDFLTGLKNPRQFYKSLNKYLEVENIDQKHVSLLYIDVDHFKTINDTYGHDNGDLVLKDLGHIFKQTARSHDIIARKGGEEFAVLLIDCTESQAINAAERFRKAVESHDFKLSGHQFAKVTISIGVSSIPEKTQSVNELIKQADQALYAAKNAGRNQVMIAS